jgi:hypothetical protein
MNVLILLVVFLVFAACGSSPSKRSDVKTGPAPAWILSVDSVFGRDKYAAAVGFANTRTMAEENAFANLTAFFGQTIQVDQKAASAYQQAVVNGVMQGWSDTAEMSNTIQRTAQMESLLGAEIKEVWKDERGTYHAIAVMEKERSARLYNEMLQANLNIIRNVLTMTPAERSSLDGVIRYRFAAAVADVNVSYAAIVRLLDATPPSGIVNGDMYRVEAQNIVRTIPVGITITNDRGGRIFTAFARCFSTNGFETTTNNSRYMLNVNLALSPVELPNNPNTFSRIEITANFTDTNGGIVLIPYSFVSREGSTSLTEAENRCFLVAERNINEEFMGLLTAYLSQLMPKK